MDEQLYCEKCGRVIKPGTLVCGYCGKAVPKDSLAPETVQEIRQNQRTDDSLKPNTNASVRGFGITLMIIGGLCDIICLFLIGSGSFDSFQAVTIIGTIAFAVGFIITFAFRG